ncbi:hypothetical protein [Bacillus sp. 2205SS5-2]|uniref:hypothetical protein n=1 Tax=Bacillus sp. 2205SS5-2 TaxID=3109031 RepID=UPI0030067256
MNKMRLLVSVVVLLLMTGCQLLEKNQIREEINKYIESMNEVVGRLDLEEQKYKSKYVDEEDNDKAFAYIEEEYIPAYKQAIKDIESIQLKEEALIDTQKLIVQAYNLNIKAVKIDREAYLTGEEELSLQYDEIVTEMEALYEKHDQSIKEIGEKNGVDIVFEEEKG